MSNDPVGDSPNKDKLTPIQHICDKLLQGIEVIFSSRNDVVASWSNDDFCKAIEWAIWCRSLVSRLKEKNLLSQLSPKIDPLLQRYPLSLGDTQFTVETFLNAPNILYTSLLTNVHLKREKRKFVVEALCQLDPHRQDENDQLWDTYNRNELRERFDQRLKLILDPLKMCGYTDEKCRSLLRMVDSALFRQHTLHLVSSRINQCEATDKIDGETDEEEMERALSHFFNYCFQTVGEELISWLLLLMRRCHIDGQKVREGGASGTMEDEVASNLLAGYTERWLAMELEKKPEMRAAMWRVSTIEFADLFFDKEQHSDFWRAYLKALCVSIKDAIEGQAMLTIGLGAHFRFVKAIDEKCFIEDDCGVPQLIS